MRQMDDVIGTCSRVPHAWQVHRALIVILSTSRRPFRYKQHLSQLTDRLSIDFIFQFYERYLPLVKTLEPCRLFQIATKQQREFWHQPSIDVCAEQ